MSLPLAPAAAENAALPEPQVDGVIAGAAAAVEEEKKVEDHSPRGVFEAKVAAMLLQRKDLDEQHANVLAKLRVCLTTEDRKVFSKRRKLLQIDMANIEQQREALFYRMEAVQEEEKKRLEAEGLSNDSTSSSVAKEEEEKKEAAPIAAAPAAAVVEKKPTPEWLAALLVAPLTAEVVATVNSDVASKLVAMLSSSSSSSSASASTAASSSQNSDDPSVAHAQEAVLEAQEQAALAIGNVLSAPASAPLRGLLLQSGVLAPLLALCKPDAKISVLRPSVRALACLCSGPSSESAEAFAFSTMEPALPVLAQLLRLRGDETVLIDATAALLALLDAGEGAAGEGAEVATAEQLPRLQSVVTSGAVRPLVDLLLHSCLSIQVGSLRCVACLAGGAASGASAAAASSSGASSGSVIGPVQSLLDSAVLPSLRTLLTHSSVEVRADALRALARLTSRARTPRLSAEQIAAVLSASAGLVPLLVARMKACAAEADTASADPAEMGAAAAAGLILCQLTQAASDAQVRVLASQGVVQRLCQILSWASSSSSSSPSSPSLPVRLVIHALEALDHMLVVGAADAFADPVATNTFDRAVTQAGGIRALQNLATTSGAAGAQKDVADKALAILDTFFPGQSPPPQAAKKKDTKQEEEEAAVSATLLRLTPLLHSSDVDTLNGALLTLQSLLLCSGSPHLCLSRSSAVLSSGLAARLVVLLLHPSSSAVVASTLKCVVAMASGPPGDLQAFRHRQALMDLYVLPCLLAAIAPPTPATLATTTPAQQQQAKEIRIDAVRAVGLLYSSSPAARAQALAQAQAASSSSSSSAAAVAIVTPDVQLPLDARIMPCLISVLKESRDFLPLQVEASLALAHVLRGASGPHQVRALLNQGAMHALCAIIASNRTPVHVLKNTLECIEALLQQEIAQEAAAAVTAVLTSPTLPRIRTSLASCNGLSALAALRSHADPRVASLSTQILQL